MKFEVKESLTEEDVQRGLKAVIRDGISSQSMVTLTSGAFLVAFAIKLGASNKTIGLLSAIPPLLTLIQIPSIYLVEKIRIRRPIVMFASIFSRTSWLLIAATPFLFPIEAAVFVLIIATLFNSAFGAVSSCSWNSWMRDLIPQEQLGVFYSRRMRLSIGLGVIISLLAAFYVDWWKKSFANQEIYAYSSLFFFGFIAGMIGVYFQSTIPEPQMVIDKEKPNFFKTLLSPFRDDNFKRLIWFSGSWNFAVNLAAPFFMVYMLKRLQLDMSLVIFLTIISQITNLFFLRIWGPFVDRFSNKSVLRICGPLFILCIFAWTFTTLPEKHLGTIPLLIVIHIFLGLSMAGVTLASGNIGLKLSPKGYATSYLAANSIISSLAAGIGPLLGGTFADFFEGRELSLIINWRNPVREMALQTLNFQHWDFFFFLAFLIGLYSINRLTKIKEVGEVDEKIVINELVSEVRREMRNLSTVGGLRQMTQFPFNLVRSVLNRND